MQSLGQLDELRLRNGAVLGSAVPARPRFSARLGMTLAADGNTDAALSAVGSLPDCPRERCDGGWYEGISPRTD